MQNQQTTESVSAIVTTSNRAELLPNIVEEYKSISLKLFQFSDVSDVSAEKQERLTAQETELLDRQAELLDIALSSPVTSMDEAKALLGLWHLDVVQSATPGTLDASDEIVAAVHDFISKA